MKVKHKYLTNTCIMKKNILKKSILYTLSVFAILSIALAIHLYMVIKPKKQADDTTLSMARFDFKQPLTSNDASKISKWLSTQQGVNNVLFNEESGMAVFSFYPLKASEDIILNKLVASLNYKVERFIPDEKSIKNGCPAGF